MASEDRQKAISETIHRIREKASGQEVTRDTLDNIREELITLARRKDLFSIENFPPPGADSKRRSCLYRLSEDQDHGFALYLNVASGSVNAPPHDHTTWAVIVGIEGQEENRFYKKVPGGVEQIASHVVEPGTGVTMLPDEIHTIHIEAEKPVLNFHMYGLGLEQLDGRNFWNDNTKEWKVFPAHTDIREARN
ncbi:cysteine dioxygenase [Sneathiella litorea]|uniref:Cysteine dioxygenase n=1 Tax=Sneathiella litorea TaxID=2606216 RepID=A0A6L8W502_9PROT|nr:cysteine dioxygenase [Sneathiella litorea]MZR29307.1 cysteine dioxygenase [Sneathiella litorea]